MRTNSEIYLIGLTILIFLIIVFLYIRKISNSGKLKVKIEPVTESLDSMKLDSTSDNQESFEFNKNLEDQDLAIFYLVSIDRSMFDINQVFGFMSNYGAVIKNKFFSFKDSYGNEKFRVINALNPGTFEQESKTFALVIVSDLGMASDPLKTVKEMVEFSLNFSDKFHATLCDQERTPITKQMISHIEARAQDIERIKQLNKPRTML
tara:strand:- start:1694 stop:2314 length:621 start_codon:yes stop_codon:yes gene_type:complete